jgi:hypothetical protein
MKRHGTDATPPWGRHARFVTFHQQGSPRGQQLLKANEQAQQTNPSPPGPPEGVIFSDGSMRLMTPLQPFSSHPLVVAPPSNHQEEDRIQRCRTLPYQFESVMASLIRDEDLRFLKIGDFSRAIQHVDKHRDEESFPAKKLKELAGYFYSESRRDDLDPTTLAICREAAGDLLFLLLKSHYPLGGRGWYFLNNLRTLTPLAARYAGYMGDLLREWQARDSRQSRLLLQHFAGFHAFGHPLLVPPIPPHSTPPTSPSAQHAWVLGTQQEHAAISTARRAPTFPIQQFLNTYSDLVRKRMTHFLLEKQPFDDWVAHVNDPEYRSQSLLVAIVKLAESLHERAQYTDQKLSEDFLEASWILIYLALHMRMTPPAASGAFPIMEKLARTKVPAGLEGSQIALKAGPWASNVRGVQALVQRLH